ncbi:serine/threonine protein kinase [Bacillus cereus]|uniref:serine/threonine-protein kinase n=1 Tax=Bacillus cereus group TaxID=86661 RepID=UPI000BF6C792|nr:serine/threonine-protein kinase [Bacillus thuringiensis]PFS01433.1 hypothetical protein COK60_26160 [Bacillus thuringiensis]
MLVEEKKISNRYVLKKFIASGGMGDVWKAFDSNLGRYVAIKFPRTLFIQDEPKSLSVLKSEAQTGAKLIGHPNIISILDFGFFEEDGKKNYYIVMELINGIDVLKWINDYKPILDSSLYYRIGLLISLELCKAIEYSHKNNILHRDIKPNNLFLSGFGMTKIGDFGLSRFVEIATRTHTVKTSMTYAYASPEQWHAKRYTKKSDIYQIGCTIYHLLTGELPFNENTLPGLLKAHLNQNPTLPHLISDNISEDLSNSIVKAMAKNASDRIPLWQLYEAIATELLGTYEIEGNFTKHSDETLDMIAGITDFSVPEMKEGEVSYAFADYGELLSESIQLILLGATEFKIIKRESSVFNN